MSKPTLTWARDGDFVVYRNADNSPSNSYWLIPGTQIEHDEPADLIAFAKTGAPPS